MRVLLLSLIVLRTLKIRASSHSWSEYKQLILNYDNSVRTEHKWSTYLPTMSPSLNETGIRKLVVKITLALIRGLIFKVIHIFMDEGVFQLYSKQVTSSRVESQDMGEDLSDGTIEGSYRI